ncbi:hypothetical protein RHMOL_Rhmol13G0109900 [Rhododendron molle]|uniref:Uncharacterized protein n=1 Tax=Rhododendron molle TaxID=49168 RepID=A0ACC0L6S5_RHOML|nr:hypothetical protein RHMOL_Rhmol13G0109900 [Rhododendron molle]
MTMEVNPSMCSCSKGSSVKGLQEKIKLVPIDLEDRPSWYKEKVYPPNKVPSLEHDNEVRGESLDLIKYIDSSFEGPALYPNDPAKREFAEELLSYTDTFNRALLFSLKGESLHEISSPMDYLETALFKFNDGPFFLGRFSLVDIAYAPFVERFHPLMLEVKNCDFTTGRPMLTSWIEDMNKIEAYKQTKRDPQELMAAFKKGFSEIPSQALEYPGVFSRLLVIKGPLLASGPSSQSFFGYAALLEVWGEGLRGSYAWGSEGLQEKIKLVPIDLEDRPSWYKEKVYPPNKVPSLEHDNEVRGESLDLMKYIDSSFEGPALYPNDPAMREFAEELLSYSDTFNRAVLFSLKGESLNEISSAVNYLETALAKFSDGPFFLGQFSLVDIAYAPFVERFHPLLLEVKNYDITTGRPMLRSWIENMNKIEAYKQTKRDPQELVAVLKKRFSVTLPPC